MLHAVNPPNPKIIKAERHNDSLWLYSDFGIHRLSPRNARNIRVSFTRENDFLAFSRPGIISTGDFKGWSFEVTDR